MTGVDMPRVRDLLYRFRPSGTPGAATAAGVPADRTVEAAAELEPVFAQLAETERQCAEIMARGRADADAIRARDSETARSILATGRALVPAERATAAARARDLGRAESRATLVAGQREVEQVHVQVEESLPEYVERVVASVRSLLEDAPRAAHHRPGAT